MTRSATSCYAPPKPVFPIDLRLDGNEGAAPAPSFLRVIENAPELLRVYPKTASLEAALAEKLGVDPARVVVTAGADEALDRLCRAFLAPGREIVLPSPTFEMLPRYAALAGATCAPISWMQGALPVDAMIAAASPRTAMVAVVTPNNPTGAAAGVGDLRRLSEAVPKAILLVDLAYTEFAEEDLTRAALELPNAVVVRTFSKAWGLAGLRVGFAVAQPAVAETLRAAAGPYPVSGLSLALAEASLRTREPEVRSFVASVRNERRLLVRLLVALGGRPLPSQGNFVLCGFDDAGAVWNALARRGIAVRIFPDNPALENFLRITCPGDDDAFRRLSSTLVEVLS